MGRDALGWRAKIAVALPSTNTILQPDLEALRPEGVTNHTARILIPDMKVAGDDDFVRLVRALEDSLDDAIDRAMTAAPDHLIQGVSALSFWDGRPASEKRLAALEARLGVGVTAGGFACEALLNRLGIRRVAILSPYFPVSDREVTRFFTDCGFDVVGFRGLRRPSPIAIAETPEELLEAELRALDSDRAEAILQVGTNLSMRRLAERMTVDLGKPVIAINAATYWHALRRLGLPDPVPGSVFEGI